MLTGDDARAVTLDNYFIEAAFVTSKHLRIIIYVAQPFWLGKSQCDCFGFAWCISAVDGLGPLDRSPSAGALLPSLLGPFLAIPRFVSINISGYVYVDSAGKGVRETGEWGISGVNLTLQEVGGFSVTVTSNSAGYYDFTNVPTGAQYSITETQPSGFVPDAANPGNFLTSTGGTPSYYANPSTNTTAVGTAHKHHANQQHLYAARVWSFCTE